MLICLQTITPVGGVAKWYSIMWISTKQKIPSRLSNAKHSYTLSTTCFKVVSVEVGNIINSKEIISKPYKNKEGVKKDSK